MTVHHAHNEDNTFESPLAYHVVFHCYGTRLPGDIRGTASRHRNIPGSIFIPYSPSRMRLNQKRMRQPPYELDIMRRRIVMQAIMEVCRYRRWELIAAHVRTTHVHAVVQAACRPEKVMTDFKAYASRALTREGFDSANRKRWSRHGSTIYKWSEEDVESAVHYVIKEQGEPMEVYER